MHQELPFPAYPGSGRELLGRRPGCNTRRADGPEFMRITGVSHCAYCNLDMTSEFKNWLTMALDHVVPISVCTAMSIDPGWVWNYANCVLACGACNGFCNRYKPTLECSTPLTLPEFFDLRNRIFLERRRLINARRAEEEAFFETKPWDIAFRETVFEVGAEGGTLSIIRQRNERGTWEYAALRDETTLSHVMAEDESTGHVNLFEETGRSKKFKDALHGLDGYPWFQLFPMKVKAEFSDIVLREVGKRGGQEAVKAWTERLQHFQPSNL